MNFIKTCVAFVRKRYEALHQFSRYILHGSLQFTAVLYLAAGITYRIAPYVADSFEALAYSDGFLSIAPVVTASGIIAALVSDLVLQHHNEDREE